MPLRGDFPRLERPDPAGPPGSTSLRWTSAGAAAGSPRGLMKPTNPIFFMNRPSTGRHPLLPIFLLSAAGFTVLTTEFVIVGLLPAMARDLRVSIPTAGLLVTLFAFTVAAVGPPLTAFLSRFGRKRLFVSTLLLFSFSNLLAALAPNFGVMAFARFVPALMLSRGPKACPAEGVTEA